MSVSRETPGDVERLWSHAELRAVADVVLPIMERERVRVVEGLVATIKALPGYGRGDHGESLPGGHLLPRDAVLAVVEAAREATDD